MKNPVALVTCAYLLACADVRERWETRAADGPRLRSSLPNKMLTTLGLQFP